MINLVELQKFFEEKAEVFTGEDFVEHVEFSPEYAEKILEFLEAEPEDMICMSNQELGEVDEAYLKISEYVRKGEVVSLYSREFGVAEYMIGYSTPIGNFIFELEDGGYNAVWWKRR